MDDDQVRLTQNWGFSDRDAARRCAKLSVDAPRAQFDIALSALDWLGLADHVRARILGAQRVSTLCDAARAGIRKHLTRSSVGGVSEDGRLLLCNEDLAAVYARGHRRAAIVQGRTLSFCPQRLQAISRSFASWRPRACAFQVPDRWLKGESRRAYRARLFA